MTFDFDALQARYEGSFAHKLKTGTLKPILFGCDGPVALMVKSLDWHGVQTIKFAPRSIEENIRELPGLDRVRQHGPARALDRAGG